MEKWGCDRISQLSKLVHSQEMRFLGSPIASKCFWKLREMITGEKYNVELGNGVCYVFVEFCSK